MIAGLDCSRYVRITASILPVANIDRFGIPLGMKSAAAPATITLTPENSKGVAKLAALIGWTPSLSLFDLLRRRYYLASLGPIE